MDYVFDGDEVWLHVTDGGQTTGEPKSLVSQSVPRVHWAVMGGHVRDFLDGSNSAGGLPPIRKSRIAFTPFATAPTSAYGCFHRGFEAKSSEYHAWQEGGLRTVTENHPARNIPWEGGLIRPNARSRAIWHPFFTRRRVVGTQRCARAINLVDVAER